MAGESGEGFGGVGGYPRNDDLYARNVMYERDSLSEVVMKRWYHNKGFLGFFLAFFLLSALRSLVQFMNEPNWWDSVGGAGQLYGSWVIYQLWRKMP